MGKANDNVTSARAETRSITLLRQSPLTVTLTLTPTQTPFSLLNECQHGVVQVVIAAAVLAAANVTQRTNQ